MMTFPHGGAGEIWRDGSPDPHNPEKAEIRDWGLDVEGRVVAVEAAITGTARYTRNTLADLNLIATPATGDTGYVLDDAGNTGTYEYDGAAWNWAADLPGSLKDLGVLREELDAKSDMGHGHPISGVTGLQAALDGKATAAQGALADTALQQANMDTHKAAADQHPISGVTGLQAALDGKATAAQGALADTALQQANMDTHKAAADQHPISGVTGLQAALDGEKSRAELAEVQAATVQRPGDFAAAYAAEIVGSVPTTTPYTDADVVIDADLGGAVKVDSATYVAARVPTVIEPGRVYQVRYAVKRITDPADPLNDAVEVGVRWLTSTQDGVSGGDLVIDAIPLEVADGVQFRSATCSLDVAGVDHVIPAAARYGRAYLRTYGIDHETLAGRCDLVDITEAFLAQAGADASVKPANLATVATTGDSDDLSEGTDKLLMTIAERTKLSGVAASATANSADAVLLSRVNHTGEQPISSVTDLQTELDGKAGLPVTDALSARLGGADLLPRGVGMRLTGEDGRVLLDLRWDRAAGAYRFDGHAMQADTDALSARLGGADLLPRGVGMRLTGEDGRVLLDLRWDRAAGAYRFDGHAMQADTDALSARLGGADLLPRGVGMRLTGEDGRVLLDLRWDRDAGAYRFDGHALQSDTDALSARLGGADLLPRGVGMRLTGEDGRVLMDLRWDRDAGAYRFDGHALRGEDQVFRATERIDAPVTSIRAARVDIDVKTDPSGIAWVPLPSVMTPHVAGVNSSGVSLDLRRGWGLPIRGRHYLGDYDPGPVSSGSRAGSFTDTLPAASGYSNGQYLEQAAVGGNTVGGDVYAQGDLAISNGTTWTKQAAPPVNPLFAGQFVSVSAAGMFRGIALEVGDRLIFAGRQKNSGVTDTLHWALADAARGDICMMGETATPVTTPPTDPQDGDLWEVAASDGSFAGGDGMLRIDGAWARIPGQAPVTVADGESVWIACDRADQIEVRRTDKVAVQVPVKLGGITEVKRPVVLSRDIWWVGDSMPSYASAEIAACMPDRDIRVDSMGGATSYEVLAHVERLIRDQGDPYGERVMIAWHGQNNAIDVEQVNHVNARLAAITGAVQRRCLLMSKLGHYEMSWSGSRIVVVYQEQQFYDSPAQTAQMRNFIRDNYPELFFDTRAELCATAGNTPDLLHPGKTEAETAETWGIVPFSYFFDYTAVPWLPSDLTFVGYWADPGLPTGGADLDYYVRSVADGEDGIGQLIVREGGAWVTRDIENEVHMVPDAGNVALANRIKRKLTEKGW